MARIVLGGLTTLNLATHLDPQFVDLYNLRELVSTPGYVAATPRILIDASGNIAIGTSTPEGRVAIDSGATTYGAWNATSASMSYMILKSGGTTYAYVGNRSGVTGGAANDFSLRAQGAFTISTGGLTERFVIDAAGNVATGTDNAQTLGTSSRRWSVVYAGTGAINTSDAREKTEVRALTEKEIAAAKALCSEIGVFRFLASVAEKGDDARDHIGLTVQRAIEIMSAHGLSPFRYAFICHDQWAATVEPAKFETRDTGFKDSSGDQLLEKVQIEPKKRIPGGDRYGFRYDQLALFIMRGLEARIAALEE